eukprot:1158221-Pelagomonas_calceolata.AAC.4
MPKFILWVSLHTAAISARSQGTNSMHTYTLRCAVRIPHPFTEGFSNFIFCPFHACSCVHWFFRPANAAPYIVLSIPHMQLRKLIFPFHACSCVHWAGGHAGAHHGWRPAAGPVRHVWVAGADCVQPVGPGPGAVSAPAGR